MKSRRQLIYLFVIVAGILVLVNILSDRFFIRLDFTSDKRYTLSRTTKNILHSLKDKVTITAYFSTDMPVELQKTKRDFKEMLVEYANRSGNKLTFKFIDPTNNEKEKKEAQDNGIQAIPVSLREKDQEKQQNVFLGALIQMGDQKEIIPVIQPGAAMEYALSFAIKKLLGSLRSEIGLLQGQGEPSPTELTEVYTGLNILYNVEPLFLADTSYNLSKFKTIAIVAPTDTVKQSYLNQLDKFIAEGGNIFMALNHVDGNFQTLTGNVINTGLAGWLKQKGLVIEDNFIVDVNCGTINVQQAQGFMSTIPFHYLPVITNFAVHPVTKGLEGVILQFASSMAFLGNANYTFTPLAMTSEKSGVQHVPVTFDINKQWSTIDFPSHNLVVAAALEPKIKKSKRGKIIVVSNGNFVINGQGDSRHQLEADNINLMVNSIDWLSDDTGLIDLRTKGVTTRLLRPLEDSTKATLKFINFLLPMLLVIGYGIYRVQRNRSLRIRRMEAHYI